MANIKVTVLGTNAKTKAMLRHSNIVLRVPGGVPGPPGPPGDVEGWLNALSLYTSDFDAAANALPLGGWYLLSDPNDYGIPGGIPKKSQF